jgi:hypothetical protein
VEVGAHDDGSAQPSGSEGVSEAFGKGLGRAEETLCAGDVEDAGAGLHGRGLIDGLDARGKVGGTFQKHGAGGGFGLRAAGQKMEAGNGFSFETGETGDGSFEAGRAVEGTDALERRAAIEDSDRLHGQVGAQAQQSLGGELFCVDAGVEVVCHRKASRCAGDVAHQVDVGGLRWPERNGVKRWRPELA